MSEKKKRDFGEPLFHCFVALSVKDTIERIRSVEQVAGMNYIHINGNDDFHYFLLQYSLIGIVQGRLLGALNRWAQTDETSVGIFGFDSHLYDRMASASLHSDAPSIYDIEAYYRRSQLFTVELTPTMVAAEKELLKVTQKVLQDSPKIGS